MKDDFIVITGMLHQIQKLLPVTAYIEVSNFDKMEIFFAGINRNEDFKSLAEDFGATISNKRTTLEDWPFEWSFEYNGTKFYTYAREEFINAEDTKTEV